MTTTTVARTPLFDRRQMQGKKYWREHLSTEIERATLPVDRPRSAGGRDIAEASFELGKGVRERLDQISHGKPFLVYVALVTAARICLERYAARPAVAVGSPPRRTDGAEGAEPEAPNVLAVAGRVDRRQSFRELLMATRQHLIDGYGHQHYPFDRVLRDLGLEDAGRDCPLFGVSIGLAEIHGPALDAGEDVRLRFRREGGRLRGRVLYRRDLFDPTTVERFRRHLERVLEAGLAEPNRFVGSLEPWTPAERSQVVVEWNDSDQALESDLLIHQKLARWARETPGRTAVAQGERAVSYAALDRMANRMAHHLLGLGVPPEARIGLAVDRSPEMVAAIFGVLKAGAAWVPLDPEHPRDRRDFIVEDAGIERLIGRRDLAELDRDGIETVIVDEVVGDESDDHDPGDPELDLDPDRLAYVIYTSGSTGRPKGTLLAHRGLVNLSGGHLPAFHLGQGDARVVQFSSLNFDASVWEIALAVARGAALHLLPDARLLGGELASYLERERITHATLPPSVLATVPETALPELRTLVVAGEACPLDLVDRWARGRAFYDAYGPTETTVCASTARCVPGEPVTIGRPVPNFRLYVHDRHLVPTLSGVAGELAVGGPSVARGYLGRPALTAERFVPDPHGAPGARLYRTGDLVRWRQDGRLDFLGRIDHQVKLRGFRIEPGEIEEALHAAPLVRDAAVAVRGEGLDRRLVAYFVSRGTGTEDEETAALVAYLEQRLPDYMMPGHYVRLERLPLNASGKVDLRALPEPETVARGGSLTRPKNPGEEVIARVFAAVLHREQVGTDENFFEIGGHSLLATQVVSRVSELLSVGLSLRHLFDAPTVIELARAVERVRRQGGGPAVEAIEPLPRDGGGFPLSFAQQRIWFLDRLEPNNPAYNMPLALSLVGPLAAAALAHAFGEVLRRHEILRTTYGMDGEEPRQRIAPPRPARMPVVDLSGLVEERRRFAADALTRAEARRSFDLERGPVQRLTLLRLAPEEHHLLCTFHHVAGDLGSLHILRREVTELYRAATVGEAPDLPELPVQYADFAVWQRRHLSGEVLEAELDHWRERLAGPLPVLELPVDHPRPALQTFRGAGVGRRLGPELTAGLRRLATHAGASLFMAVLAGFQVLLARLTGARDLLVGTPVLGRRAETEDLIGLFLNTLVIRTEVRGESSFNEYLEHVRERVLDAFLHQDLPFERLIESLQPERDLSQNPLVQVMFMFQNRFADAGLPAGGLRMGVRETAAETAKFDLTLAVDEGADALQALLEYNLDLFEPATVERITGHLVRLLEAAADDPARKLGALPLLSDTERRQLLHDWNDTAAPRDRRTLAGWLAHRAAESPEAVAIEDGETELRWSEVMERSRRLAARLRALGAGPETLVGLCMERRADALIGFAAVLACGGAFVPLDPTHPSERHEVILRRARLPLVVAHASLAPAMEEVCRRTGTRVVALAEGLDERAENAIDLSAASDPGPESLAYVLFTSGSTGEPKGVQVSHGAVVNFLLAMNDELDLEPDDVFLALTTFSFDISLLELFAPVIRGGRVALADRETATDGAALAESVRRSGATWIQATPSGWRVLLETGWSGAPGVGLLSGGEPLDRALAERLLAHGPLWNLYGPTETTIWSTVERLDPATPGVPVGKPLANTRAYVLDRRGRPQPVGIPGRLLLAGDGLARGYVDLPARTARSFVPDPFAGEAGARMYETGDLARWRPSGRLDCLGRTDRQVKIRGFRVELGEVEAVLGEAPGVREAAVVHRRDGSGGGRLVAYVVASGDGELAAAALRRRIASRLPDYMMPAAIVELDALPRTANDKVDHAALAAGEGRQVALSGADEGARNAVERALVEIWEEVLDQRPIGVHQSFFDLGGHSLLAVRLLARIEARWGRSLSLASLFQAPTVARQAVLLRQDLVSEEEPRLVTLQPRGDRPPFFCVHPAGGGALCFLDLSLGMGTDRPFYGLTARGGGAGEEPVRHIEEMAERYVEAVRSARPEGPYHLGGWSFGGLVAFEMARRFRDLGTEVSFLGILDTGIGVEVPLADDADVMAAFLRAHGFPIEADELRARGGRDEQADHVIERMRASGLIGEDFDPGTARRHFEIYDANVEAAREYRPRALGGVAATVFRTAPEEGTDATAGWAGLLDSVDFVDVPGTHNDMVFRPHAASLARRVLEALDRHDREGSGRPSETTSERG